MLPIQALLPPLSFMVLLLTLSLYGLAASGHFPRERRAPSLASGLGSIVLFGSIAAAIVCLAAGLCAAWWLIPWPIAVIGGGLAVLCAPLILQKFPDWFVDGRISLLIFAGAALLLAMLLVVFSAVGGALS